MTLISFEDAVTARNLNPNQTHAVYYVDGAFANHTAVRAQCPHAKLYGITVFGAVGPGVFAVDSETGDLNVAQTIAWVAEQVKLKVPLICVYANLNRWQNEGLLRALAHYGHRIKRWVAHYDGIAEIPSWADADQFADPGPVDRNVALANFFGGQPVVPQKPHGHVRFEGTADIGSGNIVSIHGLPGVGVHFVGPEKWVDFHIQIGVGKDNGGHWRKVT